MSEKIRVNGKVSGTISVLDKEDNICFCRPYESRTHRRKIIDDATRLYKLKGKRYTILISPNTDSL
jgi:hypothetical protein